MEKSFLQFPGNFKASSSTDEKSFFTIFLSSLPILEATKNQEFPRMSMGSQQSWADPEPKIPSCSPPGQAITQLTPWSENPWVLIELDLWNRGVQMRALPNFVWLKYIESPLPGQWFGALADALCCPSTQELQASSLVPSCCPWGLHSCRGEWGAGGGRCSLPRASEPQQGQRWPRLGSQRNRWAQSWHLKHWHFYF